MSIRSARLAAVVLGGLLAMLLGTVAWTSSRWVGATFPGFLVLPNGVVASAALPEWGDAPSELFQRQVITIDGTEVATTDALHARVAARPPGTPFTYRLRAPGDHVTAVTVPSRRFGIGDWLLLFAPFLVTGVSFAATGLLVFALKPDAAASRALLAVGLTMGLWAITGADLYGPSRFVRLHVLAESLVTAAFVHLALVFPTVRLGERRPRVVAGAYAASVGLALVYEWALGSPAAYTTMHLLATLCHPVGALALIATTAHGWATTRSPLVRRRSSVVAASTLAAFLMPAVVFGASAMLGGSVPVNATAFTAFLFPLGLGYAILTRDLFEIDVLLRRAVTYGAVLLTLAAAYFAVLLLVGRVLTLETLVVDSPLGFALLNLGLLFAIAPIRARVQTAVDRVFFRKTYDSEEALGALGHRLASVHTTAAVVVETRAVLDDTVAPLGSTLLVADERGTLAPIEDVDRGGPGVDFPTDLRARLDDGRIVARYEWEDGSGAPLPAIWQRLAAEVLVPIRRDGRLLAVLAVGGKQSGRPYGPHDVTFLRAVANQMALGLVTARAFGQLEALNASLESQVADRTSALAATNAELASSVAELRLAYEQLERSQASLFRADRLSTLGRLTAGMAHEVNTPLGAVLNALMLLRELAAEYASSIDDPHVGPGDHHEIASELAATIANATTYARRAAAFVNRVKAHGRDARSGTRTRVLVRGVVLDVEALLAHRLRAASCTLVVTEEARDLAVVGEPERLSQVLVNLVTNALDAYEDTGRQGRIEVAIGLQQGKVTTTVRDQAGGMPPEVAARAFEELFTTKPPGRGTGLGLWIARTLVEEHFGGTLVAETTPGVGSTFRIAIPAPAPAEQQAAPPLAS